MKLTAPTITPSAAMGRASWAMLALSSLTLSCAAATEGMIEGCSLEKNLVCGDDGFTYQNVCLAQSQGVVVALENPCSDRSTIAGATPANLLVTDRLDTSGRVTMADLGRFQDEGFRLIGKAKLVDTPLPRPTVVPGKMFGMRTGPLFATRVTSSGYLYIRAVQGTMAPTADGKAETPPFRPAENATRPLSLQLLVLGADDRVQVTSRTYPYSAVGYIFGFERPDAPESGYGCSGALVGDSAILTAGHCVYDAFRNEFSSALWFYPGQLAETDYDRSYPWSWMTTYWNNAHGMCYADGSCEADATKYDFAVIRLALPAGRWAGYLGMAWESTRRGYSVTSAGYPSDKLPGTMWRTSGTLNAFSGADSGVNDGTNGVVNSDLDIAPGQSGSNVWDNSFYTRALMNADSDGLAFHRTMTQTVFDFVLESSKGLNLFEKEQYGGEAISLTPGKYPEMPSARTDNWASSATITPGCRAMLYNLTNFRGGRLVMKADKPSFKNFNKKASSLKLVCG